MSEYHHQPRDMSGRFEGQYLWARSKAPSGSATSSVRVYRAKRGTKRLVQGPAVARIDFSRANAEAAEAAAETFCQFMNKRTFDEAELARMRHYLKATTNPLNLEILPPVFECMPEPEGR